MNWIESDIKQCLCERIFFGKCKFEILYGFFKKETH